MHMWQLLGLHTWKQYIYFYHSEIQIIIIHRKLLSVANINRTSFYLSGMSPRPIVFNTLPITFFINRLYIIVSIWIRKFHIWNLRVGHFHIKDRCMLILPVFFCWKLSLSEYVFHIIGPFQGMFVSNISP